ncbi:MAG: hypothetical protein AAGB22_01110 [Bacteroidota bacterium]
MRSKIALFLFGVFGLAAAGRSQPSLSFEVGLHWSFMPSDIDRAVGFRLTDQPEEVFTWGPSVQVVYSKDSLARLRPTVGVSYLWAKAMAVDVDVSGVSIPAELDQRFVPLTAGMQYEVFNGQWLSLSVDAQAGVGMVHQSLQFSDAIMGSETTYKGAFALGATISLIIPYRMMDRSMRVPIPFSFGITRLGPQTFFGVAAHIPIYTLGL